MGTICIAICLVILPTVSGLRFVIDREECLQQKVKEHERVVGSFVVFDSDSPWRDSGALIDLDVSSTLIIDLPQYLSYSNKIFREHNRKGKAYFKDGWKYKIDGRIIALVKCRCRQPGVANART